VTAESHQAIHDRERDFHDGWAAATCPDEVAIRQAFEAITAPENRFILGLLGDLKGKRVLDIGTGLGESAIFFALRGAIVTATDISPEMIRLCEANATRHGVGVRGVVSTAERLDLPPESFDVVYAGNLLHHVVDRVRFFENVVGALKPGGVFVSWDPLKYNPAINVYRRIASQVRTPDERPLGKEDVALARRHLPGLQFRTFWLATLALFLRYYFLNRKDPNRVRYWKEILGESDATIGWWFNPLQRLDGVLLRLPGLRWLAWNVVLWGAKPSTRSGAAP
jgi:SAM-dependent methyltransferase